MLKNKPLKLLTPPEIGRLRAYCTKNGGQEVTAVSWGTSSSRISRILARKHGPQGMFRQKLIQVGVIKKEK